MRNLDLQAARGRGVLVAFAAVSLHFLWLVDTYAVDVLFWDQWDLYGPFTRETGAWELFRWQHGPHRQGVGFLLTRAVAELSGWNVRAEAFAVAGLLVAAAGAALALRRRLWGPLTAGDVAIPLLLLTPGQYPVFVDSPNASHGAAPLLLLVLQALAWTIPRRGPRLTTVVALGFLLVHTGFGLFAGITTPLLLAAELAAAWRAAARDEVRALALALAASLAGLALFFVGWRPDPAAPGFVFPSPQAASYPRYAALMFASAAGVSGTGAVPTAVGFALLAATLAAGGAALRGLAGADAVARRRSAAIASLVGFSLLFCAATAVGRISLGLGSAGAGRYVPLVAPGLVGGLLAVRGLHREAVRRGVAGLAALLAFFAAFPVRDADRARMEEVAAGKRRWVAQYLETRDLEAADRAAGFPVWPWDPAATRMEEKLAYMERWGLGPWRGRAPKP